MSYGQNSPYGLRYLTSLIGGGSHVQTTNYLIRASADGLTTYSTSLYTGDLVMWNLASANNGGGTIQAFIPYNAVGPVGPYEPIGVFQGCYYQSINSNYGLPVFSNYWPASTQVKANTPIIAQIIDDPFAIYSIQVSTSLADTSGARLATTAFGQNANIAIGGTAFNPIIPVGTTQNPAAGSPANGSAYYLDGSTIADTAALPLKIIGYTTAIQEYERTTILASPGITAGPQYFLDARVMLNAHVYKGVGVIGTTAA